MHKAIELALGQCAKMGVTWDALGNCEYGGKGYEVSLAGYGCRVRMDSACLNELMYMYVDMCKFHGEDVHVGIWVDDGDIYFDLSEVFLDKSDAVKYCIERKQRAYYDFEKGESVYV